MSGKSYFSKKAFMARAPFQIDPRLGRRGEVATRLDNLTDAVFGIAITLLIFSQANPNSFGDLLRFTKTLPAFLISIGFLMLIWTEHRKFSQVYGLYDSSLLWLNTLFLAMVIFYVYPLRFLTLFLTHMLFDLGLDLSIRFSDVPRLMMYYGLMAFALYFLLFLFYHRALKMADSLELSAYERFYTREQRFKMVLMFSVPLLSVAVSAVLAPWSSFLAGTLSGITYFIYTPLMFWWGKRHERLSAGY
jgi:uncharacterized membrane protein